MAEYRVVVSAQLWLNAAIYVDAENEEVAKSRAMRYATEHPDEVEWVDLTSEVMEDIPKGTVPDVESIKVDYVETDDRGDFEAPQDTPMGEEDDLAGAFE